MTQEVRIVTEEVNVGSVSEVRYLLCRVQGARYKVYIQVVHTQITGRYL